MVADLPTRSEHAHALLANAGSARDELAAIDDDQLREILIRLEQVANTAQALQAQVMVEMGRRAHDEDQRLDASLAPDAEPTHDHAGRVAEFVSDEIALLLSCTRVAAARRYAVALDASQHGQLMASWSQGVVCGRKVAEIAGGVAPLDEPGTVGSLAVDPLVREAVGYAEHHTVPQLRAWLGRRVVAAAPEVAERRRVRATDARRVTLTPLPDGVAELCALLPAIQTRQIYDTVNAIAHAAGAEGVRTMDQRRADALVDLLLGRADPPRVEVHVVVPAEVLDGESDEPGWIPGLGVVTAGQARDLSRAEWEGDTGQASWRRLLCDPTSGVLTDVAERRYRPSAALDRAVRLRDLTCRFPGCRRSALGTATGTDVDHAVPWPVGRTQAPNLAVLCRHHHRLKHSPGWGVELQPDGRMTWITPTGRQFRTDAWQYGERPPPEPPPPDP